MNQKTIIIAGILASLALVGGIWYFSQGDQQTGSQQAGILSDGNLSSNQDNAGLSPATEKNQNLQETENLFSGIVDNDFVLGNPEAPVTMIEYSSHLCGHCVNFHKNTLPLLLDRYIKTGKMKIISRFLSPIEISGSVVCAQEQDYYWHFSNYLFENISTIDSLDKLKNAAGQLGLNQQDFSQCLDSESYKDKVVQWFEQANQDEVSGTPTFFINGQKIVGNQPYSVFEGTIEKALSQ